MFEIIFNKLFERGISKYKSAIKKINTLEKKIRPLTDSELQNKTTKFIYRISEGENINKILHEAFALVREASRRTLGLRHFDVQLMGGLVLNEGKIAEMKTGEGKTLVALLPTYLNALKGKGVQVVTVNEYLAARDAESMGQVHAFLGLSVGLIQSEMTKQERQINYNKDITYVTNSELGFDYLRDNMVFSVEDLVQRPFCFSILDEIDSILIDESRTPLVISAPGAMKTTKYKKATEVVKTLLRDIDYEVDEKAKNIFLTEKGIIKSEQLLNSTDLYDVKDPWSPYIFNAIKAKELFLRDINYIIKNDAVVIVDEFTGRIMTDRRWSDGIHQAIESKEDVKIQHESETLASITYQNFFLLYPKLAGMTGTAKTEETELTKIYGLEVICIPTNNQMIRKDFPDLVYKNQYIKWKAVANECLRMYSLGRPVLVGTTNIETSEKLSSLLQDYKLPHNLLNARPENVERESEIIAQAGRIGAITIATNMAGRGTDILLGGNSKEMAKSTIKTITNAIQYNQKPTESVLIKEEFQKLYEILKEETTEVEKETLELDTNRILSTNYKDNGNTTKQITSLRAVYLIILFICEELVLEEKKKVVELGGLHVIGTEKHESRRIDNQLRGRAGRQGDPGSSRFFLSVEDNLLRIFGGDMIKQIMDSLNLDDEEPIESSLLSKSLESAQKKVEIYHYEARKHLFEYDEVLNYQRQAIYTERRRMLESQNLKNWILAYTYSCISDYFTYYIKKEKPTQETIDKALNDIENLIGMNVKLDRKMALTCSIQKLEEILFKQAKLLYEIKENQLNTIEPNLMREVEKSIVLKKIDSSWKEHLKKINSLREHIGWRSYGQKDPLIEYKHEAYHIFLAMINDIKHSIVSLIFKSYPY